MPADDLLEAKEVWENTVMLIKNKKADSLPSMAQSRVLHVRPHGSNKADTLPTHYGTKETKKSVFGKDPPKNACVWGKNPLQVLVPSCSRKRSAVR